MNDPADRPAPTSGRWSDLRKRVLSAIVMIGVGATEIWLGGTAFAALVVLVSAVMVWELATMTAPARPTTAVVAGGATLASLALAVISRADVAAGLLLLPALYLALTPRRDRQLAAIYAAAILIAGFGLITVRQEAGTPVIWWLILVVIASDVLGYFAGRLLGGPKFWPAISPKKTWSGTVAGWLGAVLVGLAFWALKFGPASLIWLSPVLAFAGQLGDIVESWVKRRAGVKDASNLIPGHGGVLDRFDAMIGAVVALMILDLLADILPFAAG